jgi:hypothetical protein
MKKISIIILSAAIAMSSCKKKVDAIRPSDTIQEENAFVTVADLDAGAIGAYAAISGENIIYVGAIMSDEVKISSENRGQGQFLYKWVHVANDGDAGRAWQNLYIPIDRANRVLAAIDRVPTNSPADQATKDIVKGEMLGLRAWAHFELWRWYAKQPYDANAPGVPYMKVSAISQPSRPTTAQNFADIEADLSAAKALIPSTYTGGTLNVGRITRIAISAIQARVALYKGDWTNAITYATEAITAVPLATRANFPGIWTEANNNEILWELKRVTGQNVSTLWRDTNGDIFYQPSDKLRYSYDTLNDVRFPTYIKVSRPGLSNDPDDTVTVNKYPGSTAGTFVNDIKLFRVAEMYLIRAEARAEQATSDLVGAAADVNAIRNARILPAPAPLVFATKQAAIDAIYFERFLELPFEGHRYFDLKRRGITITRGVSDSAPEYRTLPASSNLYLLPIPQREILANPNMQQNPGY